MISIYSFYYWSDFCCYCFCTVRACWLFYSLIFELNYHRRFLCFTDYLSVPFMIVCADSSGIMSSLKFSVLLFLCWLRVAVDRKWNIRLLLFCFFVFSTADEFEQYCFESYVNFKSSKSLVLVFRDAVKTDLLARLISLFCTFSTDCLGLAEKLLSLSVSCLTSAKLLL